jgi:hypothetical protein
MPWLVGMDEAGYGPNLGPLVLSAVAMQMPDPNVCLWTQLAEGVRKAGGRGVDQRLFIDDSKAILKSSKGEERLEAGALALRPLTDADVSFHDFLAHVVPDDLRADQLAEPWSDPTRTIPVWNPRESLGERHRSFTDLCAKHDIRIAPPFARMLSAERYNERLVYWDNKASVLLEQFGLLLRAVVSMLDDETHIVADKLGGRHFYGPFLQELFPERLLRIIKETEDECLYELYDTEAPLLKIALRPKADAGSLPVAAASMLAKYLREVTMISFNDFWRKYSPTIKPTAGYPEDAKRFYAEIRPLLDSLGLPEDRIWRRR